MTNKNCIITSKDIKITRWNVEFLFFKFHFIKEIIYENSNISFYLINTHFIF